jgi:hypothetical protein
MEALVIPSPMGLGFEPGLSGPFVPSDYSGGPAAKSGTVVGAGIVGGYEKLYETPDSAPSDLSVDIVLQDFATTSDARSWFKAAEAGGPAMERGPTPPLASIEASLTTWAQQQYARL